MTLQSAKRLGRAKDTRALAAGGAGETNRWSIPYLAFKLNANLIQNTARNLVNLLLVSLVKVICCRAWAIFAEAEKRKAGPTVTNRPRNDVCNRTRKQSQFSNEMEQLTIPVCSQAERIFSLKQLATACNCSQFDSTHPSCHPSSPL